MARKSTLKALPKEVLTAVQEALLRDVTIDGIVTMLGEMGHGLSRSAVGRYTQDYRAFVENQRDMNTVASAFGKEFGGENDDQSRLMGQLLTTMITGFILPKVSGADIDTDALELSRLTRAAADLGKLAKDQEERLRAQRKESFEEAAKTAETVARNAGASDTVIELLKTKLLGLAT